MPKPAISRSALVQLQLVVGDRGQVLPYRHHTDRGHRSIGWYVQPARPVPRCRCAFCAAARQGVELYLGYHSRDAIVEAGIAAREHEEIVAA